MSEKLTPKAQRLFCLARTFVKEYDFKYCWTSFGQIFIQLTEGQKQIHIYNEADLNNLRKIKWYIELTHSLLHNKSVSIKKCLN